MATTQKHLKELLKEDQEPFYLKDYIADKKCMLKKQAPKTQIQLKKPIPLSKSSTIFSKNACFFSIQDSPDLRKSPLFDFTASPISKKSPNRVLLHVPAKTASLLLEAALRIQQKSKPNPKTHNVKSSSFGLFGSMLKRLTLRNRTHKLKHDDDGQDDNKQVTENAPCPRSNSNVVTSLSSEASSSSCSSSSCYYNGRSTTTSSLDLESSSSGRSFDDDDDDEFEFINVLKEDNHHHLLNHNKNGDYGALCLSPFHFTKSPARHIFENDLKYEQENSVKCQLDEDDDEDKEQNSPVSVLDPPFEDDYDGHDDDCYDQQQCSYAFVQRAKQQLLHKLHRFEKLAELDPIELEKRMIEDEEEEDDDEDELFALEQGNEIDNYDFESFTFAERGHSHDLLEQVVSTSGFQDIKKPGIKRLISDLIFEEENVENAIDNDELLVKRVCKRLESWREVECNTIDMMVGMDLRREIGDWKRPQNEISETAIDIEVAIFAVLVKELISDLAY